MSDGREEGSRPKDVPPDKCCHPHHQARPKTTGQRPPSTEYWWPNQRFVNLVFPADTFSLAHAQRDKYSYQLFAHPGTHNSDDLRVSQMTSRAGYDVKRVAVDKPYSTKHGTECRHLHWASKPWLMEREGDCTGHNNGGHSSQPITALNPFATNKSDPDPASDHSHTTCDSSDAGSDNASRASASSCCSRREGFNGNSSNNNNNNNFENVVGAGKTCGPNDRVGFEARRKRNHQNCDVDMEKARDVDTTLRPHPGGSSCQVSAPQPKGAAVVACNNFLPQLALPSEVRDPKTAPGHCTVKGDPDGRRRKPRSREAAVVQPDLTSCCVVEDCQEARAFGRRIVVPGYGTYQIIGGHQYKERPEEDPRDHMDLPPRLSQYREYQRRCPCPRLGRYDRADADNEMILPSHRSSTLLKASLSPFTFMRNPKPHRKMAAMCQRQSEARKSGDRTLQWMLPSFL